MGAVLGGGLAIYLLCKILEWALLKRFLSNYNIMIFLSSAVIFFTICITWYIKRNEAYAFHSALLIDYFIAALILPFIRSFLRKRKAKTVVEKLDQTSK